MVTGVHGCAAQGSPGVAHHQEELATLDALGALLRGAGGAGGGADPEQLHAVQVRHAPPAPRRSAATMAARFGRGAVLFGGRAGNERQCGNRSRAAT